MIAAAVRSLPLPLQRAWLQLRILLSGFAVWWCRELWDMVPDRARDWIADSRLRPAILLGPECALVFPTASVGREAILRLDPALALRTEVGLPLSAERHLSAAISYEIERYTPFRRATVYYGYRVVKRDAGAQRLLVDLTVAPKAIVDPALDAIRARHLQVAAVIVAAGEADADESPDLLQSMGIARTARRPPRMLTALAMLAAVLAIVAVAIPFYRLGTAKAQAAAALAEIAPQARESIRLRDEITARLSRCGFLAARRAASPSVSALLLDVTRLLPDDSWLTELQLSGGRLQLTGRSPSASGILGIMVRTPGLAAANFLSPVVQDVTTGRERFDIAAQLKQHEDAP